MKKQLLTLGVVASAVAIGGSMFIHALISQRPPQTRQVPMPKGSPAAFGDRAMKTEARLQPHPDPLAQNLLPPELIMRFQDRIGLSDEQRQAIMADMQKAQPKFEQLQQQLQREQAALGLLLEKEPVELESVLAQSDKVQNLEREMRRTHLTLLIGLKNRLAAEQQAMLREIRTEQGPGEGFGASPPRTLQEKMQRLQAGIQQ